MITKYNKFNESIKFLLVGPSKEKMGDYWKSLSFDRTFDTPEEFFLYMIDGMKIKEQTKYPNVIFWMNHGKVIIEQNLKINVIMVDTNSIWSVF